MLTSGGGLNLLPLITQISMFFPKPTNYLMTLSDISIYLVLMALNVSFNYTYIAFVSNIIL